MGVLVGGGLFRFVSPGKNSGRVMANSTRDRWGRPVVGSADYITLERPLFLNKKGSSASPEPESQTAGEDLLCLYRIIE